VVLEPSEPDRKTWVAMNHDIGVRLFRDVDVYLHPAGPARSRLGGFFQFWWSPLVLIFVAIVYAAPAIWMLTASGPARYQDPLPAEWVGRWVAFARTPWPPNAADPALHLPAYYWWATLLMALLGAPFVYRAATYGEDLWHGRLVWGTAALFWTVALACLALHFATYRVEADEGSLRERSALGWRQVPWSSVKRLEDESVRQMRWSKFNRRYEPGLTLSHRRSLVLVDAGGKRLTSIGIYLEPPPARRKMFELIPRKTGLTPVDTERRAAQ
jgi:hypothetical protein